MDSARPIVLQPAARGVLVCLQYAYPVVLLVFFVIAFMVQSIRNAPEDQELPPARGPGGKPLPRTKKRTQQEQALRQPQIDFTPGRKRAFVFVTAGVVLTFLGNAAIVVLHALVDRQDGWWCGQHVAVYIVGSFTVHALVLISLIDTAPSPTSAHAATWLFSLAMEVALLAASMSIYSSTHWERTVRPPNKGPLRYGVTEWEAIEIMVDIVRVLLLIGMLAFFALFSRKHKQEQRYKEEGSARFAETTGLLNGHANGHGNSNGHAYGTTTNGAPANDHHHDDQNRDAWSRPDKVPVRGWYEYIKGYALFFPYVWPARSRKLQAVVFTCFLLVLATRALNVLVPYQSGVIVDELSGEDGAPVKVPWGSIGLYIFYRVLQGNNGLLGAARSALWIPISQYAYRELSTASFEHVHSLSLDFHLGKKTGEVISALNKGNSINTFLDNVTFSLLPMLIDMLIAVAYFLTEFDAYYALIIFIMTVVYLYLTVRMSQWRSDKRREMIKLEREADAIKSDSLMSYEAVKYFNAEDREFARFRSAVQEQQKAEYVVMMSLQGLNVSQNTVFMIGLLVTSFIAAYQVTTGQRRVGKFVTLITYMAQLQAPLNFFGTFYRSIQSSMINAERLLELFKEQPTVVDAEDVEEIKGCEGGITYDDVQFAYDTRHPALDGVTFNCAPGTTTALVGESGGGKSTIFRLLFRFYDLSGGTIRLDGQDVTEISIDSLRQQIGVVPQDTVLFNETIMYNLRYANPNARNEEIFAACKAASIHDKIMSFPDGYDSKVGERGLKLSGGEKQRVAIARTILKNPRIILLDEATAALDSDTESNIQDALAGLVKGRTTLVIAHRLSTVTSADQILVLQGGKIIEAGNHPDLLDRNGRYASMWKKQMKAQKAAEEAKVLTAKARRLRSESQLATENTDDSASQSEDEKNAGKVAREGERGVSAGESGGTGRPGHRRQTSSLGMNLDSVEGEIDGVRSHPH